MTAGNAETLAAARSSAVRIYQAASEAVELLALAERLSAEWETLSTELVEPIYRDQGDDAGLRFERGFGMELLWAAIQETADVIVARTSSAGSRGWSVEQYADALTRLPLGTPLGSLLGNDGEGRRPAKPGERCRWCARPATTVVESALGDIVECGYDHDFDGHPCDWNGEVLP